MNGAHRLLPISMALAQAILHAVHSTPAMAVRSAGGAVAARAAIEMIGVPYSWGGGGVQGPGFGIGKGAKTWGFDCSGLAEYAWARAGVRIGSTTQEQWRSGIRISKEEVEPGDLVFYDNDSEKRGPEHVGLVVDATRMVHSPYTEESVRVDPLDRRTFLGAVRPGEKAVNSHGPAAQVILQ
ncbi:C40 family peptidase [Nonomuraea sp. CA-141351]|uniref:C40 family peptidase n=1 Tax=Nonomuraea sp. CA-141351 TaxID=3239996 RepID=UPI003D91B1B6